MNSFFLVYGGGLTGSRAYGTTWSQQRLQEDFRPIRFLVNEKMIIPVSVSLQNRPTVHGRLVENFEVTSKSQAKASHGVFRRFLYEARAKSMPNLKGRTETPKISFFLNAEASAGS
ncbi:hypothetical protein MUO56_05325 [Candidatus Bathyarchaeota archaeon]|nr:hypothetical protein [Candidatus Bathyarchaeota archaeon]